MTSRVLHALLVALLVVACGGQSKEARQESARLGDQSGDVPPATLRERDWKKAAQGRGAAGAIPAEELARMEKESAPGGRPSRDAGHGP